MSNRSLKSVNEKLDSIEKGTGNASIEIFLGHLKTECHNLKQYKIF